MSKNTLFVIPILLLVFFIGLTSCNNKSKNDYLKESISQYQDSTKSIEVIKYIPREYSEIKTDTILSNGFIVKVITFSNMNTPLIKNSKLNFVNYKNYFRPIECDVIVFKNNKRIFKEYINVEFVSKHLAKTEDLEDYINNSISIDQEASLLSNKLVLTASLYKPESTNCISYQIIIDESGNYTTEKIETNART